MDIPEMGWCSVVVTDGDRALADRLARGLADIAWSQREEYTQPCPTYRRLWMKPSRRTLTPL
jgi:microcystin degradation protein MlrC